MMKWFLSILIVTTVALGIWWQTNTTKISYVNGLDRYADRPNREYILVRDCYIFAWKKGIDTANPLLGVNAPEVKQSVSALPKIVSQANIGKEMPLVRVMDVIPQGTRFRITSVRREESRSAGQLISYEIVFLDDTDRPYSRVDIRPTLIHGPGEGDPPEIDITIAVPWKKV
jgi:hypothetical protein